MPPLIIAHRGDSSQRPENTLAAFAAALEAGASILEADVQLTRDGHVVVIHDPSVDRTTDGVGRVSELSLEQIRKLSAGYAAVFGSAYADERVPTLADLLALARGRGRVMIEIKTESVSADEDGGIEARTIDAVRRADMASQVALISFDHRALVRCRRLAPEITRGHLFWTQDGRLDPAAAIAAAREVASELVMPEKTLITGALAEAVTRAGMRLATWVVDEVAELRALARFPLYGIATNQPAVMLEAVEG
jgi:glycerophosphoryl diester phosphodiesterase